MLCDHIESLSFYILEKVYKAREGEGGPDVFLEELIRPSYTKQWLLSGNTNIVDKRER